MIWGGRSRTFSVTTPDGVKLSAWFFPARESSSRKDKVILVCHGNGGNISHRLELLRLLLGDGDDGNGV